MQGEAFDADVVIAGLGPTGLVLAHMLGMRGHKVIVLEREPVFYGNARAVYTDDECLRVFQHIGCAEELGERMISEVPVQFTRPDGSVLGQYKPLDRPLGWPVVNFFYQPFLETTLTELLSRYPDLAVRRGHELVDFDQDGQGVTVRYRMTQQSRFGNGDPRETQADGKAALLSLRCRYLVGTDGGRSAVREVLGIGMTGRNFPENWLVVDLERKQPGVGLRHLPYFNFVVDPKLPVVSCIQPGGFHRFEFMMMEGQTKEWLEQPDTVRMLLSKFVDPDDFTIKRKLVYTFNALMADRWRDRRVFLAGDAAHMTPQFMGQGASSGIRDAYNLGWKLSLVLNGLVGDALLDTYQRERQAHAQAMIDVSVLMKDVVSSTSAVATTVRDSLFALARVVRPLREFIEQGKFKPRPIYRAGHYFGMKRHGRKGAEGTLSPQPKVKEIGGKPVLLDELLGDGFAIVGHHCDPREHLRPEQVAALDTVGCRYVTLYPFGDRPQATTGVARNEPVGVIEVEDIENRMVRWFRKAGFSGPAVAVLRPDRFTYAIGQAEQLNGFVDQVFRDLAMRAIARP